MRAYEATDRRVAQRVKKVHRYTVRPVARIEVGNPAHHGHRHAHVFRHRPQFPFQDAATFFKAAEQVCEIDFDVTTLRLIIESCIMHKTNLIVREADPDEEPGENEFRILKQLSVGTDSRKGNPTGKKAEKLK